MAQPRPSCTLILDIDETLATEETKLEVGRCYTYVGSALIRPHRCQSSPRTATCAFCRNSAAALFALIRRGRR